jgi:hypothetical protein
MKCKWYAEFEGVCINGECPYRGDVCPTSEHPEVCKHAEAEPEVLKLKAPMLSAKELAKTLRLCDSTSCVGCALFEFVDCGSAAKQQAADMLEKLEAEKDTQKPEWISTKDEDELPKNEQEVLIYCNRGGFRFVCPAIYEDGTMLTQNSRWNWYNIEEYGTYSEENDDYFVAKGWWENRQFTPDDVYNCPVDCEVTHWRPLPKSPKEETHD